MQCVTNLSNRVCFGRVITKSRATYQSIASTHRKNDFGEIGREGDDAIDTRRQTYTPSGIVCDFPRVLCWTVLSISAGSKQYY